MSKPKIVCIGSNIESEVVLQGLVKHRARISALITRPSGNQGSVSDYVDLHEFCQANDILTIDTTNVNSEECIRMVEDLEADYLFTLGWSQIFSNDFIKCFNKAIIGSHPTKLPDGKGRAPIPWTILLQKKSSAVSFFLIANEGVDDGEIILQKNFEIPEKCYAWDLYHIVSKNLRDGFLELYDRIVCGKDLKPIADLDDKKSSIYAKRSPSDGKIDFTDDSEHIERLVRAVSRPYPGAFSFYEGEKIIFHKADLEYREDLYGVNGQIMEIKNDRILVATGRGLIWLGDFLTDKNIKVDGDYFKLHDKLGMDVENELYNLKCNLLDQ